MTKEIAIQNINDFMNNHGYDFSVHHILDAYTHYFKKGYYVSETTMDSIKHLTEELEFLSSTQTYE